MPALQTPVLQAAQWLLDPTARTDQSSGPWSRYETRRLTVTTCVAVLVWLVASVQVRGVDRVEDQAGWTAIALVASLASASSCGAFLVRGYRRTRLHRNASLSYLCTQSGDAGPDGQAPAKVEMGPDLVQDIDSAALVANDDMSYFHRVQCPMVLERTVAADSRSNHVGADRRPCPWCQP